MLNWIEITALIVTGVMVGFINTLAGGGTIISLSVFLIMGLPIDIANGTNRIAVILQNMTSSQAFYQKKVLDLKKAAGWRFRPSLDLFWVHGLRWTLTANPLAKPLLW